MAGIRLDGESAAGVLIRGRGGEQRVVGEFCRPRGKLEEPGSFAAVLRELAPGLRMKHLTVAFLLGDGPIAFEVKSFPAMKGGDFRKAAAWYQVQNRRTDVELPCFGAWTQPSRGGIAREAATDALLLETDQVLVDELLALGESLGVASTVVVPVPFAYHALMNSAANDPGRGATVLLVETRERDSALTVFRDDRLLLHRSIDLSPDPFELTLTDFPGISDSGGVGTAVETESAISTSRLVTEITRTRHYVESRFQTDVEHLYLTTGDETIRGVLEGECALPASPLASPHPGDEQDEEVFLGPLGAALRVARGETTGILPQDNTSRLASGFSRIPRKIVVSGAVRGVLLLLLLQLAASAGLRYTEERLARVNGRYIEMVDRYVDPDFEARLSEWEKYALTINRYRADQYLWSDLNVAVSRATPYGVLLDRIEGSVPANEEAVLEEDDPFAADDPLAGLEEGGGNGFEGADEEERPWIEIRGTAGDIEPIRTFVANLEKSREFRNVLLQAADRSVEREGEEIEFRITCRPMVKRETYVVAREAGDAEGRD